MYGYSNAGYLYRNSIGRAVGDYNAGMTDDYQQICKTINAHEQMNRE